MLPEINSAKQDVKEIKQDLHAMRREVRRNFSILRVLIIVQLVLFLVTFGLLYRLDTQLDNLITQIRLLT